MEKAKKNYVINRNGYVSLLLVVAIAAAVVAELFLIMSDRANSGYPLYTLETEMLYTELAVGLLIAEFVLSAVLKGKVCSIILDVLRFAAVAMLCMVVYYVLIDRTELMGYVWFSDLESGNQDSVNALNYAVIAAACDAGAIIVCAVTGGFDLVTSIQKKRTREDVLNDIAVLNEELAAMGEDDVFELETTADENELAAESADEPEVTEPEEQVAEDKKEPESDAFIETLNEYEKKEFYNLFITDGSKISGIPAYKVGENNKKFFNSVFIRISKVRGTISEGLMIKISNYYNIATR